MYKDLLDLSTKLNCDFLENEPLKNYTSFKIGGEADVFIKVKNEKALSQLVSFMSEKEIPFFVLGNGSNLLVADDGFRGVVLSLRKDFKTLSKEDNFITCAAGNSLARVCVFAMKNSLSGLEFAWGIPGSCGGALFMNAGAYGNDISDIIDSASHITYNGKTEVLNKNEMNLSYRKSIYSEKPFIITSIKLNLIPASREEIKAKMYENIIKRKTKQPLEFPNAGSVFKRPGNGYYAAALIESAGLKSKSVGGAMVSGKHSGFIVNTKNASAKDVAKLIRIVKEEVYKKTGILLQCEVKTLGNIKI